MDSYTDVRVHAISVGRVHLPTYCASRVLVDTECSGDSVYWVLASIPL